MIIKMRRIQKIPIKKEKVVGVCMRVHPYLFEQSEQIRKQNQKKLGINISQIEATGILAKKINMTAPTIRNFTGGKTNVKKKQKRRYN